MHSGRVGVLFVSYTSEWTGPANSLLHLVRHLRQAYRIGVGLPGPGLLSDRLDRSGIPQHQLGRLDKWAVPRLASLVRREGYDVVYANTGDGTARVAFLAARLARVKFVCHVRAIRPSVPLLQQLHFRFADEVVAVSRACAEPLRRLVPPERLHVVYNGVPPGSDATSRGRSPTGGLRRELGIGGETILVLSVGHLSHRKAQEHAVRALERLSGDPSAPHLVLAGSLEREPGYAERVRELAAAAGLKERVHLLGFRRDVPALMEEADIYLHTALADPHPRSVLEAMAAGLPVVAFAVDGVEETVVDDRTGVLVEPGDVDGLADGLRRLLASGDVRRRLGSAGEDRVRSRFSDERTAREVSAVIASALGGSVAGGRLDAEATAPRE